MPSTSFTPASALLAHRSPGWPQNLFGLAMGPFIAGALSDAFGLQTALAVTPLFGIAAAWMLLVGSRTYKRDVERAAMPLVDDSSLPDPELAVCR